ncbi:alpha/beta fold hydrolase [Smaragdicoccus niigatensis]|uniref:alpha/beta fold hydrolase n=1 Tax=Smaragdicoccus niigatensis TaxID=359359 RepID=UPI0003705FB6|nr:alpha/beta fold hydrolase [Smaragdicoccus niigatensis]
MTELAYERAGTGEPLVLIHGIGGRRQSWAPVLPFLVDRFDVITLDLPGFGESPLMDDAADVSPAGLAHAVHDFVTTLGVVRPHAAGNSLGGWITLELARMGVVRSATGICPAGLWKQVPKYTMRELRFNRRVNRRLDSRIEQLSRLPGSSIAAAGVYGKPWKLPKSALIAESRALGRSSGFDRTLAAFPHARFHGGQHLDVPVTIAIGSRDVLLNRGCRETDQLPLDTEWHNLKGCGHVPMYDDPQAVSSVIIHGASRGR